MTYSTFGPCKMFTATYAVLVLNNIYFIMCKNITQLYNLVINKSTEHILHLNRIEKRAK